MRSARTSVREIASGIMRHQFRGRSPGLLLAFIGYLVVSGQSVAHGYAHLELAHHAEEHDALVHAHGSLVETATDADTTRSRSVDLPALDEDSDAPDHGHIAVDASVAAKLATHSIVAARPATAIELPVGSDESTPPTEAEPRPRRDLPTTAPPRLRGPPVS